MQSKNEGRDLTGHLCDLTLTKWGEGESKK